MMMSRGVTYEEVSIYRQPDSSHTPACGSRNVGCRPVPGIRHEQRQFILMAFGIRWDGRVADSPFGRA